MNVVIYARYSDSKQREESIEGQIKICKEYAEKKGYNIVHTYIDRALSGKNDDRPQFQIMIKDSVKGHFQGVLVYQLDRFARNRYDSAVYKNILKKNGISVISAKEEISDSPEGIILESVLEGIGEYYVAELAVKVKRGMDINAAKGMSNGGTIPLGYKVENKKYVINEATAPIVQEIFQKYADGWSIKSICESLNERQLKTSKGKPFNKSSFYTMLRNTTYIGVYIRNNKEYYDTYPRIIEDELFEKVQKRLNENKEAPARSRAKAEYILSGKLYCGYCKEKMIGHSSNQISQKGVIFNYYKCKNSGGKKTCKKKMVSKDYIEQVIVEECLKLLTPQNIKRIAKQTTKIVAGMEDRTQLKALENQIKEKQQETQNQMLNLRQCANDIVRDMILNDLSVIGAEIKELEREYAIEKAKCYVVDEKQIIDHLTKLSKGDINDNKYRSALIKIFVNKIFLYDDKFTITFKSGDEDVTITDKMLAELENGGSNEKLCLSSNQVHHEALAEMQVLFSLCFFIFYHQRIELNRPSFGGSP